MASGGKEKRRRGKAMNLVFRTTLLAAWLSESGSSR